MIRSRGTLHFWLRPSAALGSSAAQKVFFQQPASRSHRFFKKTLLHVFKEFAAVMAMLPAPPLLLGNREEACAPRAGHNSFFLLASKRCIYGGTELPVGSAGPLTAGVATAAAPAGRH